MIKVNIKHCWSKYVCILLGFLCWTKWIKLYPYILEWHIMKLHFSNSCTPVHKVVDMAEIPTGLTEEEAVACCAEPDQSTKVGPTFIFQKQLLCSFFYNSFWEHCKIDRVRNYMQWKVVDFDRQSKGLYAVKSYWFWWVCSDV